MSAGASAAFLASLRPVDGFEAVLDESHYARLPPDWVLFVTDVRDSTGAIDRGAYRAVNMVGAACIVAAINATRAAADPADARSDRLGWAFGGDGATLAVHAGDAAAVESALVSVAAMARSAHGLSLRVGRVPVSALDAEGAPVVVCRLHLDGRDALTMFRGDGVGVAETWVKAPDSRWCVDTSRVTAPVDLGGLSCHWEPFPARAGVIVSLLVLARGPSAEATYREVYRAIEGAATPGAEPDAGAAGPGGSPAAATLSDAGVPDRRRAPHPVRPDAPGHPIPRARLRKSTWRPSALSLTRRSRSHGRPWFVRWLTALAVLVEGVVGNLIMRFGLPTPTVRPSRYLPSTVKRSDFRKFDGMLRMVLELPEAGARALEAWLAAAHAEGRLHYGLHVSGAALMTCAVFSFAEDSHVHFIDGDGGGYALAAVALKRQMKDAALS
jgi:hypothetical protein